MGGYNTAAPDQTFNPPKEKKSIWGSRKVHQRQQSWSLRAAVAKDIVPHSRAATFGSAGDSPSPHPALPPPVGYGLHSRRAEKGGAVDADLGWLGVSRGRLLGWSSPPNVATLAGVAQTPRKPIPPPQGGWTGREHRGPKATRALCESVINAAQTVQTSHCSLQSRLPHASTGLWACKQGLPDQGYAPHS